MADRHAQGARTAAVLSARCRCRSPYGRAWMSTASADVRMRAATQLAHAGDLSSHQGRRGGDRIDAIGCLIGIGAWSDRTISSAEAVGARASSAGGNRVNTPEYLTS